jgi:hypothetical protein
MFCVFFVLSEIIRNFASRFTKKKMMKQLFRILCLMSLVVMLMTGCGESHQQMVLQLEELERQNRNEVLENNLDVIASEIHIGSNVATEREPGPISVENGYSIL